MTIVNDDSSVVTKLETSLTDNARVVIYDRHMFVVQATDPKYKGGGSQDSGLDLWDQVIKVGEGWVEQKL
jgi:hypothetical protein